MEHYHGSDAHASDTSLGFNDDPPWKEYSSIAINWGDFHNVLVGLCRKT
jgi:hypothetical protein